jgi:hypothetical protein
MIIDFILGLGVSDVCIGWPGMATYLAVQLAHTLLGGACFFAPNPIRFVFLAGWLCKEVFFDIAGCGWNLVVACDSVADLSCAGLGFLLVAFLVRVFRMARDASHA